MRKASARKSAREASYPVASAPKISAAKKARIFTSMRKLWARMPQVGDNTQILAEDRAR
jgi:hypothetical protein